MLRRLLDAEKTAGFEKRTIKCILAFDLASYLMGGEESGDEPREHHQILGECIGDRHRHRHTVCQGQFAKITVKSAARDRRASARLSRSTLSGISRVETQARALLAISSNGIPFCEVR